MKKKKIWMAVISNEGTVVFAKSCLSQRKTESSIVEYLRKNEEFDSKNFGEACFWIGENDLRLDLQVFEMEAKDFDGIGLQIGLMIEPPPKEDGLYRVVYIIDVNAANPIDAAKKTHETMTDPDSLAPVLEVIGSGGKITKIDLSKKMKGR